MSGERKTVWYINQYAGGPGVGRAYRAYELGRRFRAAGVATAVILGSFNDPPSQREHHPRTQRPGGVLFHAIRTNRYLGSGVFRLLSIAIFSVRLFRVDRHLDPSVGRPTAIIASSVHPFSIFAAKRLADRHSASLVYEIRDLWPLTLTTLLGLSPRSPFVRFCAFTERYALRHCDLVTSVLPRVDRYVEDAGLTPKPFLYVPNGMSRDRERITHVHADRVAVACSSLERWRARGLTVVVHAGAVGPPNAVELVVEAIAAEVPSERFALLLVGNGASGASVFELGKARLGERFHATGQVSKEDAQYLLERCDIAYAGMHPLPALYKYGVGMNKLASYLLARLPVVLPIAPCGDPVSESGCGLCAAASSPGILLAMLAEIHALSPADRVAMGERGRAYARDVLDYDKIARSYLDALDRI